jgi:hypothetical protein
MQMKMNVKKQKKEVKNTKIVAKLNKKGDNVNEDDEIEEKRITRSI